MSVRYLFLIMTFLASMAAGRAASAADRATAMEVRLQFSPAVEGAISPDQTGTGAFLSRSPARHGLRVTGRRHVPTPPPRQRRPELSPDRLVIVALNAQEREVTRTVVPDPRLIRAETVGPSGELSSRIFYRQTADLSITLPDDPSITTLKIYHPHWTGKEYVLELIGEAPLP